MFNGIIILTAVTQVLVGLFVYQKKPRSITNAAFGLISLFSIGWALTNYFYTLYPASPHSLEIIRAVLLFVVIQNTTFYVFAHNYPADRQVIPPRKLSIILVASLLVAVATMSPYVFKSATIIQGQANPNPGPLIPLFMLHALYTICSGLGSLIHKMRRSVGLSRRQLQFILIASFLNWAVVPITNFIITLALHTTVFARISPLYTLAFAGIIAYAIVTQKLFDIRAAVTRSVAYICMIATLSLIYGLVLFGGINVVFSAPNQQTLREVLSVVLVTPLALSFQMIKQFFDRLSNRLFYRDAYDFREVLDKTGNIVVAAIELHKILNETRNLLITTLKSSFIEFVLYKGGKPYFEAHTHKVIGQNALALGAVIETQIRDLAVADEMGLHNELAQAFRRADVALSLRLKTHEQVVGYIVFGAKKSGEPYTAQDKRLLLIVANELAVAIQNALRFEEIQNFNLTLQAKVDEATNKLRRTNAKLKALDETKDDFISMASHQLRTPLTSVKGYISMLLEGDAGEINPKQHEMLQQAFFSSQRMVYLIADLLNVSRLRTGKFIIEPAPVSLADMVEQELTQLEETAAARGLTLQYDKPADFPVLNLDETKTRQVVMNFVDNAIYYTPSGGHITVRLIDKPDSIELRVEDNGIGVPKSEQPHLFTKFYRAGNARKARPDGTGLGLFMAKKVVVAQGGSIIFETQEGKGSTFGFMFSKHALQSKLPEPVPAAENSATPAGASR